MQLRILRHPELGSLRTASLADTDWEQLDACIACGSSQLRDLCSVVGDRPSAIYTGCVDCHHGFLRRRPSATWFRQFYAADWDRAGRSLDQAGEKRNIEARTGIADFCATDIAPPGRVLDVGAGYGHHSKAFLDRGYAVRALEASAHRAAFVQNVLGIECLNESLEDASLPNDFDLVFANHVLEHVPDPQGFVRLLSERVTPNGYVYLAVPNLWAEFPLQTPHFVPHLSTFTLDSLRRLVEACGLAVVKSSAAGEIQVLARKLAHPQSPPAEHKLDADHWDRIETWLLAPLFRVSSREQLIIWYAQADGSRVYGTQTLGGTGVSGALLAAAGGIKRLVPVRLRRIFVKRLMDSRQASGARSIRVTVEGEASLPLEILHEDGSSSVWVK